MLYIFFYRLSESTMILIRSLKHEPFARRAKSVPKSEYLPILSTLCLNIVTLCPVTHHNLTSAKL